MDGMIRISKSVLRALIAFAAFPALGVEFALVESGKSRACFVLDSVTNAPSRAAVEKDLDLFNKHLKAVTGAELGLRREEENASCRNVIRLDMKPIDKLDARFNWRIWFPSRTEMRIEATTTSLFTALRQLIEEGCDARFLGTERCMFQFEPRKNVAVEVRERRNAAKNFSLLRDIYGTKGHRRELGLTDDGLFKYTHGIPVYAFPGDMYNAKGWPEAAMPVLKGKRLVRPGNDLYNRWQPCYSNPESARLAAENIRNWLHKNPDAKSITLGVNDNGGYCECPSCRAMDADVEKSIFSNDKENHSASYYTFVNRIAESLAAEFPDLRIGLLAYTGTIMPPKFEVARNVVPMMTFDTLSAGMDPAVRSRQDDVIRRWGAKVRETGIWDYSWGGGYFIPRVDFAGHAARLKLLYKNGGRAYFGENSMPDALDGPKTYLISRLLENIEADADAILKEWFTRYAGVAAEKPLREIYRLSSDYWRSDPMKRSALWPARNYIYNYPYGNQFYALTPGFTARLVELAKKVCSKAVTDGEKARAEVLLRHMERLDCLASFKGIAHMSPASGELESVSDAAAMLNDFADRAEGLFASWERVVRYFVDAPDFDRNGVYRRYGYNAITLLAEQFGKASGFANDAAVKSAVARIGAIERLPNDVRVLLANVFQSKGVNVFSNVGFAKGRDALRVKTTLPYEIIEDKKFIGGKALRIWPGRPNGDPDPNDNVYRQTAAFTITENLDPGVYMVSLKARPSSSAARGDLAVWRQVDGADRDWEAVRPASLRKGEPHTFVQIRSVNDTEDGVNIKLRVTGFGKDDTLDVGDVTILRISDAGRSGRTKRVEARRISARKWTERMTVCGEDAIAVKPAAYEFAHVVVDVPRILPEEKLQFTVRATLPEGAKTGRIGAMLYSQKDGNWQPAPAILWNRRPSSSGWEDIVFSTTGKQMGKKRGRYLLIFFKMKGTDSIAISSVSWKVEK